jgi:glycosyltransferase involved in cell wall biosynthesis
MKVDFVHQPIGILEYGKTGLLVPRSGVLALADAILRLFDGELRRSMGAVGRQRVLERFSWEQIASEVLECYCEISCEHRTCQGAESMCDRNATASFSH